MLTRDLLARIRKIEIKTRKVVEEMTGGAYRSVYRGRGIEFSEVRTYTEGDDVRDIDWNVTARTGVAHIKKYVEERELTVIIAVDISSSTLFGSAEDDKRDKMAETAALLAFSAIRNNDKVGLLLFSDRVESYIPPRSGRAHVMRVIRDLVATHPRGRGTNIAAALESLSRTLKKKTVIFLISDFMDEGDFWKPLRILNRRHDLAAIRVVDSLETALPSAAALELEDAETGATFAFPGSRLAAARYAAAYNNRTVGFRGVGRQNLKDYPELSGVGIIFHTLQRAASLDLNAGRGKEEAAFKTGWLLLQEPYLGEEAGLEKTKADNLKNLGRKPNPRTAFEDKYTKQVYGDHPWLHPFDSAAIEAVDMALLREVYERAFTDFAHLTVFITSDLDRADIEAYVCQYVASLQGEYPYQKTATALPKPVLKGRQLITETNAPESEPVSNIDYMYVADVKTTTRSILVSDFLDYILSARYLNLIREERGGTYHVGFSTEVPDNPTLPWRGVVDFRTRP